MTTPDAHSFDDVSILDVVVDVIRTDLKLGDVSVDRETVLAGGDLGLDSLDLLMIVTGTEKRLGIKIPNDKLGKDTMETIGGFVDFVETQRSST
jgi:acyl carrier protein